MMSAIDVKVPDIGTGHPVTSAGETGRRRKAEDALVTLESDKATMDVPSPSAGVVKDVRVKVGDKVSEGSVILTLEAAAAGAAATPASAPAAAVAPAAPAAAPSPPPSPASGRGSGSPRPRQRERRSSSPARFRERRG
jgi:pyruvate dehydrogenase E2 component (dihydrolipoamide acetyltransferase)